MCLTAFYSNVLQIDTGDLLLLATLESKKHRAWYGFMLVN